MSGRNTQLAGTTVAISAAAQNSPLADLAAAQGLTYTTITDVSALGAFGREANIVNKPLLNGDIAKGEGVTNLTDFDITFIRLETDAGQQALQSAAEPVTPGQSKDCYVIRILRSGGREDYFRSVISGEQNPAGDGNADDVVTHTVGPIQWIKN